MAADADWTPAGGGSAVTVRVIRRVPEEIQSFSGVSVRSSALILDVRVSDVAAPAPGDTFDLGSGEVRRVQGQPVRDRRGLVWEMDTAPA